MQSFQNEQYPGQSSICFLMIDKNPSIYSMLSFICIESPRPGITPSTTTAMEGSDYSLDSPIKRIVLGLWVILVSHANEFS